MSSKRNIRRSQCGDKIRYTETEAHAAKHNAVKRGHRVMVYRCRWCHTFHIGHPPARVRQSIIAKWKASR